jgi:transcriptional regulator GlxA family with amidase domain
MKRRSPEETRRIAVVAFPDVQVLDVVGPLEVFAIASRVLELRGQLTPYAVEVVATRAGALAASSGIGLVAARSL